MLWDPTNQQLLLQQALTRSQILYSRSIPPIAQSYHIPAIRNHRRRWESLSHTISRLFFPLRRRVLISLQSIRTNQATKTTFCLSPPIWQTLTPNHLQRHPSPSVCQAKSVILSLHTPRPAHTSQSNGNDAPQRMILAASWRSSVSSVFLVSVTSARWISRIQRTPVRGD